MEQSPPIDRQARDVHALHLRRLAAGRITNDEYEDGIPSSEDPAVYEVFALGVWFLCCDLRKHKLTGRHALTREEKRFAGRLIMFLRSEAAYLWAPRTGRPFLESVLYRFTFGLACRASVLSRRRNDEGGDVAYWPFYSREQYEEALARPTFLGGKWR